MPGALSHIRVLDLSRVLAGPWAGQLLADLAKDYEGRGIHLAESAAGWNYEPVSFFEKNAAALALGEAPPARKKAELGKIPTLVNVPAGNFGK